MPILLIAVVLLGLILLVLALKLREARRAEFIRHYSFPKGLIEKLQARRPGLAARDGQLVARALRQFFLTHLAAKRQFVSMPSQVTDDLWHEFILYTRHYEDFCRRAFGRFMHHTPAVVLGKEQQGNVGLRRTSRSTPSSASATAFVMCPTARRCAKAVMVRPTAAATSPAAATEVAATVSAISACRPTAAAMAATGVVVAAGATESPQQKSRRGLSTGRLFLIAASSQDLPSEVSVTTTWPSFTGSVAPGLNEVRATPSLPSNR
jgi:hypothetical protein